jgi:hypothetical protein
VEIFPITPKAHPNCSEIFCYDLIEFSVKNSFNIQELLHHKLKQSETKLMHPSSSRAFQRHRECNLKCPNLVDLIMRNKQNKQNSFIERWPAPFGKLEKQELKYESVP